IFLFFQAEDGIRDRNVTGSDVCSSDLIVNTIPSGLNPIKLSTIEVNIYCIPSTDNRLLIAVSSSSLGWVKLTSKAESIAENTITSRARLTNSLNGTSSRLPILSTLLNTLDMN